MIRKLAFASPGILWASAATADWSLNMPKGVTDLSAETYGLHMMAFWVCVAIGVLVFGVMIYSAHAVPCVRCLPGFLVAAWPAE